MPSSPFMGAAPVRSSFWNKALSPRRTSRRMVSLARNASLIWLLMVWCSMELVYSEKRKVQRGFLQRIFNGNSAKFYQFFSKSSDLVCTISFIIRLVHQNHMSLDIQDKKYIDEALERNLTQFRSELEADRIQLKGEMEADRIQFKNEMEVFFHELQEQNRSHMTAL